MEQQVAPSNGPPIQVEVKNVDIEAVIIRADGTREDLGVIASTSSEES